MHSRWAGGIIFPMLFWSRGQNIEALERWYAATDGWSRERLDDYAWSRALRQVKFARENFVFYQKLWRNLPHSDSLQEIWRDIPVLDRDGLEPLLHEAGNQGIRSKFVTVRKSSGTTGRSAKVLVDFRTHARSLAARFRALSWHSLERGTPEARFWAGSGERSGASGMKDRLFNRIVIGPGGLEGGRASRAVDRVLAFKPGYLYGYFSLMSRFAEEVDRRGLNLADEGVAAAVVTAEMSSPGERADLSAKLGLPVLNEYGCSEVDIIAFTCPAGKMHLQSENILVETEGGGKGAGEVLVTDLHNRIMPLIRYRVGDHAVVSEDYCVCGRETRFLERIEGRSKDRFLELDEGRLVHVTDLVELIRQAGVRFGGVRQFMIRQVAEDLVQVTWCLANPDSGVDSGNELRGRAIELLGPGVRIEIFQRNDPWSGRTGKRSYFAPMDHRRD